MLNVILKGLIAVKLRWILNECRNINKIGQCEERIGKTLYAD